MEKIYFKNKNGKRSQPYTIEDFKIRGNLYTDDLIWHEGLDNWTKASNIDELKDYAISRPPLTNSEENIQSLKLAINPTILFYIIISLIIGISGALLEKNKYGTFINSITKTQYTPSNNDNYDNDKISFTEYSNVKHSDIYALEENGNRYYTRWKVYSTVGNQDNSEQMSYEKTHKFLFRPYRTFYEIVNLSNEEINNLHILLLNFIYSSFVTNLIFIPLLLLLFYLIKRKKTLNKTVNIEYKPNNQQVTTPDNKKNYSIYYVLIIFAFVIGLNIYRTSKIDSNNSFNTEVYPEENPTPIDTTATAVDSAATIEPNEVLVDTTTATIENEGIDDSQITSSYFYGTWHSVDNTEFTFYSDGSLYIKLVKDEDGFWTNWKYEDNIIYLNEEKFQKLFIYDIQLNSIAFKLEGTSNMVHIFREVRR